MRGEINAAELFAFFLYLLLMVLNANVCFFFFFKELVAIYAANVPPKEIQITDHHIPSHPCICLHLSLLIWYFHSQHKNTNLVRSVFRRNAIVQSDPGRVDSVPY